MPKAWCSPARVNCRRCRRTPPRPASNPSPAGWSPAPATRPGCWPRTARAGRPRRCQAATAAPCSPPPARARAATWCSAPRRAPPASRRWTGPTAACRRAACRPCPNRCAIRSWRCWGIRSTWPATPPTDARNCGPCPPMAATDGARSMAGRATPPPRDWRRSAAPCTWPPPTAACGAGPPRTAGHAAATCRRRWFPARSPRSARRTCCT